MDNDPHLNQIQRWMQSVIMHPGGVVEGMNSEQARQHLEVAPDQIESIIAPSQSQTSIDRLEIYANAYYARLLECMRAEFPQLARALGEELFDEFAIDYLQSYPSSSYTLNDLGTRFPQFLHESRPEPESPEPDELSWPDCLVDLAVLEWTFGEVFDSVGVENQPLLDAEQLAAIGADRWTDVRLTCVPCLRLLELRFPAHHYYMRLRSEEDVPPPDATPTFLAITRRDYIVRHLQLSPIEYALLVAIKSGATVGEAIAQVADGPDVDFEVLAQHLQDWFRRWTSEGFFLSATLSPAESA